jgi:HAD superfamily hydrolase (TIGR01549 family)
MAIKAIIWDLDGTLIHFKIDYIKARKAAISILTKCGVPKNLLSLKESILENFEVSKEFLKSNNTSTKIIDEIRTELNSKVSEVEYEAALHATKLNGIDEVLKFAQKNQLKQAIYTYNTNSNAKKSLEVVDLLPYFDVIIGRDNVENPKPHEDHILTICDKLKVNPKDCVVIGDTYRDIEGAIKVNAYSIAINTKLPRSFKKNMVQKADFSIKDKEIPEKLIEIIRNLI